VALKPSAKIAIVMTRLARFVCAAAAVVALGSRTAAVSSLPGSPAAQPDKTDKTDRGEQIQNAACLGCHDLRPIQTQALDKDGWTRMLASMIDKGAEVKSDELPVLLDFLVRNHGPLPDGPGKTILLNTCTVCHDLGRVRIQGRTREDWDDTLGSMLNEGAMLSEQDYPVLLAYLVKNFRPQ
jgi:cytochrome c5